MAEGKGSAFRGIRQLIDWQRLQPLTDQQLLERFLTFEDQAAFEAIVRRHGPMVLRLCRRVLGDHHDAEDACQATFLVLARKARSVAKRHLLANWLFSIAQRIAQKAKIHAARRRYRETPATRESPVQPPVEAATQELCALLDEELRRLPDQCRAPLLLCYLEGRTRDRAARQLGWSLRTLERRLEQGRELLRARLTRRGITMSAALLVTELTESATPAALSPPLVVSTAATAIRFAAGKTIIEGEVSMTALTLAKALLGGMATTKLKIAAVVLLLAGAVFAGVGFAVQHTIAAQSRDSTGFNQATPQVATKDESKSAPPEQKPASIADGVYTIRADGKGQGVRLNDGREVMIGDKLKGKAGYTTVTSLANDNSRFELKWTYSGPIDAAPTAAGTALVIDGVGTVASGGFSGRPGDPMGLLFLIPGEELAKKTAARFKTGLQLRKHPGHRLEVRWTADKESYQVGEPVVLKVTIRNSGDAVVSFNVGNKQRSPRDGRFRFLAYGNGGEGKAVPDTGDPQNFGGKGYYKTLLPGDVFEKTVELDKWFKFTEPGIYRITGIYEIDLLKEGDFFTIWDELLAGDCLIRVRAKGK